MSSLLRLYPRAWRARYGPELEDLMAHRSLGLSGSIDLIRGAVDAHRHPELVDPAAAGSATGLPGVSPQRLADLRVARRLGQAAWVGAVAWIAGWVIAANGPIMVDGQGAYRDGGAGLPFIFLAMVLLAAGLIGQMIRVPNRARVARGGALVAIVAGPVWGLAPWVLPLGLAALVGLVVLAAGAWWSSQWGWRAATAATASAGSVVAIFVGVFFLGTGTRMEGFNAMFLGSIALTMIWLVIGATLQRLPALTEPGNGADGLVGEVVSA